jgi:hypothetical protein
MQPDARAVENPISAIFDLSEDVANKAPVIRSLVRYASAFIIVWLFVSFVLLIALLFDGNFFFFLIMLALFVIGVVSVVLLNRMNRFFKYYVARQRSIKAVRDMDPMVYAPQGKTVTERFITYLRGHNPAISGRDVEVAMPGIVHGHHGMEYSFDAYIREQPKGLWKAFGLGRHGFAIYIKRFDGPPDIEGVHSLKKAVEDVGVRSKIPPTRVVALWERKEDETIQDSVYHFVIGQPVMLKHRFRRFTCNLEIVSETEGRYDFIPYMVNGKWAKRGKPRGSPPKR